MERKNLLTVLIMLFLVFLYLLSNKYAKDTEKGIEELLNKKSLNGFVTVKAEVINDLNKLQIDKNMIDLQFIN